jgi:hypothetical protein
MNKPVSFAITREDGVHILMPVCNLMMVQQLPDSRRPPNFDVNAERAEAEKLHTHPNCRYGSVTRYLNEDGKVIKYTQYNSTYRVNAEHIVGSGPETEDKLWHNRWESCVSAYFSDREEDHTKAVRQATARSEVYCHLGGKDLTLRVRETYYEIQMLLEVAYK